MAEPIGFALTVDVVWLTIRNGRLSVLLVERDADPCATCWALPGGSIRLDEDIADAAERNLVEAGRFGSLPAGMRLEQLATYGSPDRHPGRRNVSIVHLAFSADAPEPVVGSQARPAHWWAIDDLGHEGIDLAFDHATILADGIARARSKLTYTNYALAFVTAPFTLSELRSVYETVWSVDLDPSNFRRSIENNPGLVEAVGPSPTGGRPGRPAKLYRPGTTEILTRPIEPPS